MRFQLLVWSLLLSGCGILGKDFGRLSSNGSTIVQLGKQGARGSFAPFVGSTLSSGLMIYAVNTGNPQFRGAYYLSDANQQGAWSIPNGSYNFFAIGFDNSLGMYCADGGNYLLTGQTQQVSFTMMSTNCNIPSIQGTGTFNTSPSSTQANSLYVGFCGPSENMNAITGSCTSTSGIGSAKVTLPSFNAFDGNINANQSLPEITQPCVSPWTAGTLPASLDGTFNFPLGGGANSPLIILVHAFTGSSCSGSEHTFAFIHGILASDNTSIRFFESSGAGIQGSEITQSLDLSAAFSKVTSMNPFTVFIRIPSI